MSLNRILASLVGLLAACSAPMAKPAFPSLSPQVTCLCYSYSGSRPCLFDPSEELTETIFVVSEPLDLPLEPSIRARFASVQVYAMPEDHPKVNEWEQLSAKEKQQIIHDDGMPLVAQADPFAVEADGQVRLQQNFTWPQGVVARNYKLFAVMPPDDGSTLSSLPRGWYVYYPRDASVRTLSNDERAKHARVLALRFLGEGNKAAAAAEWLRATSLSPHDPDSPLDAAELLLQLGRRSEAAEMANVALARLTSVSGLNELELATLRYRAESIIATARQ